MADLAYTRVSTDEQSTQRQTYSYAGTDDAGSIRSVQRALDLGVTFPDTAETYGPPPGHGP